MIVEIVCPLGVEGSEYARFLRLTGEALKSGEHSIRWNCISEKEFDTPDGFVDLGKVHCSFNSKIGVGMNVGTCLNEAVNRIKSSNADFIVLIDTDIALLTKDWDSKIAQSLEDYDVAGINRDAKNCLKFLGKKQNWYQRFPMVAFMWFRTNLCRELNWELCPDKRGRRNKSPRANKGDAEICGVEIGSKLKRDTGWKIPYFFCEKGYTNPLVIKEVFRADNCAMPYLSKRDRKYCDKHCTPYHMVEYHWSDESFCTHLAGSRHTPFASKISTIWRSRIKQHIRDKYEIEI